MSDERIMFDEIRNVLDAIDGVRCVAVKIDTSPTAIFYGIELIASLRLNTSADLTVFSEERPFYDFDVAVEVTSTGVFSWKAKVIHNRRGPIGACGIFVMTQGGWASP